MSSSRDMIRLEGEYSNKIVVGGKSYALLDHATAAELVAKLNAPLEAIDAATAYDGTWLESDYMNAVWATRKVLYEGP